MVPSKDMRRIQRGCTDKATRQILLTVLKEGHRYRMTNSGVMVFGPEGSASAHLTGSDHRSAQNFRADLRKAGIAIEKGFQMGSQVIRNLGYHLESLAIVESMNHETGEVVFREQ